jgi:DNA uptake protein ComE-like DNA-binding protein
VASLGKKTARSADEWLLNGSDRSGSAIPKTKSEAPVPSDWEPERKPAVAIGDETAQWLVEPVTEANRGNGTAPAQAPTDDEKTAPPAPETEKALEEKRAENRNLAKRVRELQTELREQANAAEDELTEALEERDSLVKRVEQLESKPANPEEGVEAKTVRRSQRTTKKTGKPDLNSATFEQLRDLGLSVTQSARVIAYRDVRGGFESADELDEIPGLPKETRRSLRDQLPI